MPPFTPKIGDLVIIKGGIVGRIRAYKSPASGGLATTRVKAA